jgi:hypothetical protein
MAAYYKVEVSLNTNAVEVGVPSPQTVNVVVPTIGPQGEKGDQGDVGNTGPANSLAIGTVSTGAAGSNASATITGAAPSQTLDLSIPRGDKGETGDTGASGPANSLAIGTVTTGAEGSSADATISGTAPSQTLSLVIPVGATGAVGATGPQGPAGTATTSASDLTSGTLADARLSANVALEDAANTFTQNQTLNGTNNVAPNQTTAASGSSIMTRDLVNKELANPRERIHATYWFGLQGLGEWSTIGTGAVSAYSGGGASGGRYIYTSTRIGTNAAGAALRLGNDTVGGAAPFRFSDGGALTMRLRLRKGSTSTRPGIAFIMGSRTATSMWQANAYGFYFVPQPTLSWGAATAFTQHQRINVNGVVFSVSTAGTTGGTEPTWPDAIDSTVSDGTVIWRNCGPHTSDNWMLGVGSTNASGVVLVNTSASGPPLNNRQEVVLIMRIDGSTSTPYTVYGSVERSAGTTAEVSVTTSNNDARQPQIWSRHDDDAAGALGDPTIRYFSIDGTLPPLFL